MKSLKKITILGPIKIGRVLFFFTFSLILIAPSSAQTSLLSSEIERLERLVHTPEQRHGALGQLARFYQLSGDREKALEYWIAAAYAEPGKRDDQALLEAAKLMISMGEYDKAGAELRTVLLTNNDERIHQSALLLNAQLEAFRIRDTLGLSHLLEFPVYAGIQSSMIYMLWRVTEDDSWKTRLLNRHPRSPEAEIARESSGITAALTPQWLFFPSRENFVSTVPAPPVPSSSVLQTGLFSQEDNARAMAARLANEGFRPEITRRTVQGIEYWAVIVIPGPDIDQSIRELRNAGFESFQVFN